MASLINLIDNDLSTPQYFTRQIMTERRVALDFLSNGQPQLQPSINYTTIQFFAQHFTSNCRTRYHPFHPSIQAYGRAASLPIHTESTRYHASTVSSAAWKAQIPQRRYQSPLLEKEANRYRPTRRTLIPQYPVANTNFPTFVINKPTKCKPLRSDLQPRPRENRPQIRSQSHERHPLHEHIQSRRQGPPAPRPVQRLGRHSPSRRGASLRQVDHLQQAYLHCGTDQEANWRVRAKVVPVQHPERDGGVR